MSEIASTPSHSNVRKRGRSSPIDRGMQATKKVLSSVIMRKADANAEPDEQSVVEGVDGCSVDADADKVTNNGEIVAAMMSRFGKKIDMIGAKIDSLALAVDEFKSFQTETRDALKRLRTTVHDTNDGMQQLRTKVIEVNTQQGLQDVRLDAFEHQLSNQQGEMRALRDDIQTIQLQSRTHQEQVTGSKPEKDERHASSCTRPRSIGITQAEVKAMIDEERRQEQIRTNVIISGIPELDDEDLREPLATLFPDVELSSFSASRIGKKQPGRPRLIRVKTTQESKKLIMGKKKNGLKYADHDVNVNHDLTQKQRESRRKCLPKFKDLRRRGIQCSLPVDRIFVDGKPASEDELSALLADAGQDQQ